MSCSWAARTMSSRSSSPMPSPRPTASTRNDDVADVVAQLGAPRAEHGDQRRREPGGSPSGAGGACGPRAAARRKLERRLGRARPRRAGRRRRRTARPARRRPLVSDDVAAIDHDLARPLVGGGDEDGELGPLDPVGDPAQGGGRRRRAGPRSGSAGRRPPRSRGGPCGPRDRRARRSIITRRSWSANPGTEVGPQLGPVAEAGDAVLQCALGLPGDHHRPLAVGVDQPDEDRRRSARASASREARRRAPGRGS